MFCKLGKAIRTRPKTVLGLAFFVLVSGCVAFYFYALHQWHAAQVAVKEGRPQEARSRLGLCLFLWPRSTEVHLLAARAARLSGDYTGADSHLRKCLKLEQGATSATQIEYLLMRAQTGEEDEVANALFAIVDSKHPESSVIMENLAQIYMHHHRYGLAYECLTRWIKAAPDAAKPYHWRGWVLERMNQPKEAKSDYEKALSLAPDFMFPARLRLAELLLEEKQPVAALEHLERLQKQQPDNPEVWARLGQCRFLQGQGDEARELLTKAIQKLPDDSALLVHLAKQEIQDGQPAKAETWLRHALKVDASDPEALFTLISCLQLQGRQKDAAAAMKNYKERKSLLTRANHLLQDEAKQPTKDPGPPAEIGALLLQMGHEKLGLYWLDQALLRDPRHQQTHKVLAEYFESKGQPDLGAPHRKHLKP